MEEEEEEAGTVQAGQLLQSTREMFKKYPNELY